MSSFIKTNSDPGHQGPEKLRSSYKHMHGMSSLVNFLHPLILNFNRMLIK